MIECTEEHEKQIEKEIEQKGDTRKGSFLELEQFTRRVMRDESFVFRLGYQVERVVLDLVIDVMVEQAKVVFALLGIEAFVQQPLHLVGHLLDEKLDLRVVFETMTFRVQAF